MPRAPPLVWGTEEEDGPLVSGGELARALRGDAWPDWARADVGFLVRDRSLRVGFRECDAGHRERWEDVRARARVTGHYDPRTGIWNFEDGATMAAELEGALEHVGHPRGAGWARALRRRRQ